MRPGLAAKISFYSRKLPMPDTALFFGDFSFDKAGLFPQ
jgi:hypothetical protein